jgi:REP element-mobilizing transposase RayT
MPHTYAQNNLHIIFSTKDRCASISKEIQPRLWAYIAGIGKNHGIFVPIPGGTHDHAHLLVQLPSDLPLAKAVRVLKSNSSRWMNTQRPFAWQEGYAAFSVSASNLETVNR